MYQNLVAAKRKILHSNLLHYRKLSNFLLKNYSFVHVTFHSECFDIICKDFEKFFQIIALPEFSWKDVRRNLFRRISSSPLNPPKKFWYSQSRTARVNYLECILNEWLKKMSGILCLCNLPLACVILRSIKCPLHSLQFLILYREEFFRLLFLWVGEYFYVVAVCQ